jgi:ferredoxin-NADP reductase
MKSIPFEGELEVTEITSEAEGVVSLALTDPGGRPLPRWEPGAHVDLLLPGGLERQYSLCGDPADDFEWRVAVLREPESRGGSAFIHEGLKAGDLIGVRGPRNNFPLVEGSEYRIIAGGIGVTPLLPMVERLEQQGKSWRMLYGGRKAASMAFLERLSLLDPKVALRPEDEYGLLDLADFLADLPESARVYVCGPEPLIQAVEAMAPNWPGEVLNIERFAPREGALEGPDTAFTVVLADSGITLEVPPGKTIVEVVMEAGIDVPTSCLEGTCGTCETDVLEGIPDHRDSVLTQEERDSNTVMMVCCSRSKLPKLTLAL